jgi:hypothetical protein
MRWRSHVRAAAAVVATMPAWLATTATAFAASPSPSAAAGGDPRSAGQGPGLVGDPLLAIVIVAGIGLVSLVATLLWVRATGGPRRS